MRNGCFVIDTDCHQMESIEMWSDYIDPENRDRVPKRAELNGREVLTVEGDPVRREEGDAYPAHSPRWAEAMKKNRKRYRRARRRGFEPSARLEDMDESGVDVQILNPTMGGQILGREFRDTKLLASLCRAYNDWTAEYCQVAPDRLRWVAMLPLQDVEASIEEVKRTKEMGAAAFYARPNPIAGRHIYSRDYFPLWSEIEAADRPLSIHDTGSPMLASFGERMQSHTTGHILAHPLETMVAMMSLIWYGIAEHFPRMTIVHVEGDSGWLPYWLQRMEDHWDLVENAEHEYLTMRPTEYFRRNFYVAARGDERTLRATVELTGDDNLMLSTDYPHGDGSWPDGLDALDRLGLPQGTREKLLGKNAARAFRLEDDLALRPDPPKHGGWWRRLRAGAPRAGASA